MGKTFKALKRYYSRKDKTPVSSSPLPREEDRDRPPVYDDATTTSKTNHHNPENQADATGNIEGDDRERDNNSDIPDAPLEMSDPISPLHNDPLRPLEKTTREDSVANPAGCFKIYKIKKATAKKIVLNLRHDVVRDIVEFKYFLKIKEYLKYIDGEFLKSDKGIYFKVGFESRIMQSILFDRQGNFINFITSRNPTGVIKDNATLEQSLMDSEAIRIWEGSFFHAVYRHIDLQTIKQLFQDVFKLSVAGDITCRDGKLAVFNSQVVYEVVFSSPVRFFLLMDNRGNYIDTTAYDDIFEWDIFVKDLCDNDIILPSFSLLKNRRLLPD